MKFLAAKLDESGASAIDGERGSTIVRTRSGIQFTIHGCPDPHEPTSLQTMAVPRWSVDHAVSSIVALDHDRDVIRKDRDLSDEGKLKKFTAPRDHAVRMISTVAGTLAEHESRVLKQERERYAVPAIVGSQSFGEALRDFENRGILRAAKDADRARLLQELGSGEDVDLLLAALRGTRSQVAHDYRQVANAAWRDLRDRNDPAGRAEIDLALASIGWAQQSLMHIVGSVRRLLTLKDPQFDSDRFPPEQLYELVRDTDGATGKLSAGARLFGYDAQQAARWELMIKRRAAA